ncbi:LysR family transcriptional regulator [Micromonospora krabiensis]|uniref:DNA-binding transcriptional regulator, LysR family n=1 Tax=Micromonospora krabiensis TaxID=307121 RepID=A0A1C3N1B0_9ACTN|nr:LysR family transcriptional regulator [Micromonospora krabiensis]SBV26346.1 DNA-binding transcriptional regulator, LysR family [Micromonospora krabiensis]
MDLRQMEYVVTVAEEGGFSAAARRLHVVQSAVSGTVRAVERELGAQLFHRTTHRVSLTPAGHAFVAAARTALHAARQVRVAVDLTRGELGGELRVGVMQGVFTGLDEALATFHEQHPGVLIRLRQAPADTIGQSLRDGTLDLAIIALDQPQPRGLTTRLLFEEEMVLVTAASCALPDDRPVTLPEVARLPLVDFTAGWAIRSAVDRAFRAAGVDRSTTFEVNDLLAAADLVRRDLGVCVMPESIAARFPDLTTRRFAEHAPSWTVRVVRPAGEPPPAVAALLRHVR